MKAPRFPKNVALTVFSCHDPITEMGHLQLHLHFSKGKEKGRPRRALRVSLSRDSGQERVGGADAGAGVGTSGTNLDMWGTGLSVALVFLTK